MGAVNVIVYVNYRIEFAFIEGMRGTKDVGVYKTATQVAEMLWLVTTAIATATWTTVLHERDRLHRERAHVLDHVRPAGGLELVRSVPRARVAGRTLPGVPIRALLFDFDGLIVDTETPSFASWQAVYREHGQELPLERWAAIIGTIGGFEPLDYLEELHGPIDRAAVKARREEHEVSLLEVEELRPGILEYLQEAQRRSLKTAIVSSSSRKWVDRHLARLERAEHFDEIVTADRDRERSKPRPTLYLEALERLGVDADEAIAFEDSPNGVTAAKAAGIFTVAVPNGVTASLGLDEADLQLESLAELPLRELLERF